MAEPLVLTGASSGIGRSLAHHLADEYHVIALSRRIERMEAAFDENPDVTPYALDLQKFDTIRNRMAEIRETHGDPLYLINNAGINISAEIAHLDPKEVLRSMRVNALAPIVLFQEVLPGMADAGFGRVINVTSGAPLNCPEGAGPYSSSKGALNSLTVTAAAEWEDENIKINLMSPGPCRTEMAPEGPLDPAACHPTVDYLLSIDEDGPTGRFFWLGYEVPLFPELGDVQWMEGIGSEQMTRVLDREPYRPKP
ncbi:MULTISPECIES: SDR family NAD(P)-dependent oxidoreductase [Salinibaculum]|uniref:SDR family NAD(P)-dependent oxidoreductase n=1 Tax=Salinibaculum TaxID=2732368 RepID=UPI0030D38A9C